MRRPIQNQHRDIGRAEGRGTEFLAMWDADSARSGAGSSNATTMNTLEAKHVLEAALLCASEPLTLRDIGALFDRQPDNQAIQAMLDELVHDWQGRGIEL